MRIIVQAVDNGSAVSLVVLRVHELIVTALPAGDHVRGCESQASNASECHCSGRSNDIQQHMKRRQGQSRLSFYINRQSLFCSSVPGDISALPLNASSNHLNSKAWSLIVKHSSNHWDSTTWSLSTARKTCLSSHTEFVCIPSATRL